LTSDHKKDKLESIILVKEPTVIAMEKKGYIHAISVILTIWIILSCFVISAIPPFSIYYDQVAVENDGDDKVVTDLPLTIISIRNLSIFWEIASRRQHTRYSHLLSPPGTPILFLVI
jgi:hypothetical protein